MATIDPTPEYVAQLLSMVHNPSQLSSKGFVQRALTQAELLKKARCKKCNKRECNGVGLRGGHPTSSSDVRVSSGDFTDGNATQQGPRKSKPWKPRLKPKEESGNEEQTRSKEEEEEFDSELDKTNTRDPHAPGLPDHSTGNPPRRPKIQGHCFNCNGAGHKAVDCPQEKNTQPIAEERRPPKPLCQWHPGARRGTIYLCCRAHVSTPGCRTASAHTLPTTLTPALTTRFQVHPTPPTPAAAAAAVAIAIDCEMGTALDGEPELIRVTVLDYFTGAALLDSLVWPDVAMAHYNTRYSGVTRAQIHGAKRDGTCLLGVEAARREVWRYVGVDTVVVGHDVKNDLGALRWAHGVVVDSMLVEAAAREASKRKSVEAEYGGKDCDSASSVDLAGRVDRAAPGADHKEGRGDDKEQAEQPKAPGLSLKDVSKLRLARIIQKRTHDSFEDALASRDIVHYYAMASVV